MKIRRLVWRTFALKAIGALLLSSILPVVIAEQATAQGYTTNGLILNLDAASLSTVNGTAWNDLSGNGYNATAVNSPTYNQVDGSFTLNGTNQYFTLGNILKMDPGTAFTIEVTFSSSNLTGLRGLVSTDTSVGGNYLLATDSSKAFYYVENSPWGTRSSTTLSTNTKYTATQVVTADKTVIPYLNGQADGSSISPGSFANTTSANLQIGASQSSSAASNFFNGKIYSVRIYNKALTATQVLQNYQGTSGVQLSNYGAASNCIWDGRQNYATLFQAGTTSTITKIKLQSEQSTPDSIFYASQVDFYADNAGARGSLLGTLQPTFFAPAVRANGASVTTREATYTGNISVTSGTRYWFLFRLGGGLMSICQGSSSFTTNNSWSVPTSSGSYYMNMGGSSYFTYGSVWMFEIGTGPTDSVSPLLTGPNSDTTTNQNISIDENTTTTFAYTAEEWVAWTLSGADAALFSVTKIYDSTYTGNVVLQGKNFENKVDANTDGIYVVIVTATDSTGLTRTQTLNITINDVNEYPYFSNGADYGTYSISRAENLTSVDTVTVIDPDTNTTLTWSKWGSDAALFNVSNKGVITFIVAPDFEHPTDSNSDNVYTFTIDASDGSLDTYETINITITNVDESTTTQRPTITGSAYKGVSITISVVANTPGKVTFYANLKRIPKCLNIATTGAAPTSTATCSWKPAVTGSQKITASFVPTNTGLGSVTPLS